MYHGFRFAIRVCALSSAWCLAAVAALAGQEKVEIPRAGLYGYEGLLQDVVENPPLKAMQRPIGYADQFHLEPSACGATITMQPPDRSMTMVLDYMEDRWHGEIRLGQALLQVDLYPRTRNAVAGRWHQEGPVPTEITGRALYSLQAPAMQGPTAGAGAIYNPYDDPDGAQIVATRYGPWVVEHAAYTTVVWDFDVNDAELLAVHEQTLQEAISYMEVADDHVCHSESFAGISRVVGFASQTGPEKNNRRIAAQRARSVSDYLSEHASDFFPPEEYGWAFGSYSEAGDEPLHDLPGMETPCNRAAAFTFWKKRRYVDLYTEAEARDWLEDWLRQAQQIDDQSAREIARCSAKAKFQFALNMLDLVEAGYCDPGVTPRNQANPEGDPGPAWEFLRDDPAAEGRSVEAALSSAFESAVDLTGKRYAGMYDHGEAQRQDRERASVDPYFRYAFHRENERARNMANEVDEDVFGSSAQCEPYNRSGLPE